MHSTSLMAMGTPASLPSASPRLRFASTARACSSAADSLMCKNAFTCGSRWRMACRLACVMASADSPWAWAESSSEAVRSVPVMAHASIENGGDAEEVALAIGCIGQGKFDRQRWRRFIGPKDVGNLERMSQRLDAVGRHLLELVEVIQD